MDYSVGLTFAIFLNEFRNMRFKCWSKRILRGSLDVASKGPNIANDLFRKTIWTDHKDLSFFRIEN